MERIKEALEDAEVSCGSNGTCIWREAKEDDANFLLGVCFTSELGKARCFLDERGNTFLTSGHLLGRALATAEMLASFTATLAVATCENSWVCGTIDLGQGDQHCRFDGTEAAIGNCPLAKSLEL